MGAFERRRSRKNEKRKAKRWGGGVVAAAKVAAVADVQALKELGYEDGAINWITDADLAFERGYEGDV